MRLMYIFMTVLCSLNTYEDLKKEQEKEEEREKLNGFRATTMCGFR